MKKSSNISKFLIASCLLFTMSCNKEGPGGTSSIQGQVLGIDHVDARAEITEVTITNGSVLEHGDYWLLNSPDLNAYYYIWYDNPTWISNGDPGLNGRTGIPVSFNYSDVNTVIASNTVDAILAATSAFDIQLSNDVLLITCKQFGACPDADDVTTPFSFNIDQQGQNSSTVSPLPMIDEKVYIKYGDNNLENDLVRTGADGNFQFIGLQKGFYKIHVNSKDTVDSGSAIVELTSEITKKGSVIDVGIITIVH